MNFLAHLYLSCDDENRLLGNFLADFISNKELNDYSEAIRQGIVLHRAIDSYTDQHPLVRQGTKRLHRTQRKYAPVVIDIFYDYLLARNWRHYSKDPFSEFRQKVYEILLRRSNEMPERIRSRVGNMVEHDWLRSYSTREGLDYTFARLKKRSSFPNAFEKATDELFSNMDSYEREFNQFFPEVIEYVAEFCACQT